MTIWRNVPKSFSGGDILFDTWLTDIFIDNRLLRIKITRNTRTRLQIRQRGRLIALPFLPRKVKRLEGEGPQHRAPYWPEGFPSTRLTNIWRQFLMAAEAPPERHTLFQSHGCPSRRAMYSATWRRISSMPWDAEYEPTDRPLLMEREYDHVDSGRRLGPRGWIQFSMLFMAIKYVSAWWSGHNPHYLNTPTTPLIVQSSVRPEVRRDDSYFAVSR